MLKIKESIAYINAYDFEFLRERYADEHPAFAESFDEAIVELRKFLTLPLWLKGPLAAMSHKVDSAWHTFLQHTPQYSEFCENAYRRYLHHQPRSERFPVPVEAISNFYTGYPERFGTVPQIWLEDIPAAHIAAVALGQVPDAVRELKWSGWPGWSE